MGPVSGFVLEAKTEPTLYISGDTVWCPEVKQALHTHNPDVVVCFAGGAQFADTHDLSSRLLIPEDGDIITFME